MIWLVGMMGAGKSAVGRALARLRHVAFVDTDVEIERASGRSIAQIFEQEGEAGFRVWERHVIERCARRRAVVSLGGGAIVQPGVLEAIRRVGRIVYLRATPETLLRRIGGATDRPLLSGLDREGRQAKIERLLEERETFYRKADIVVDTDDLDVVDVAARVHRMLADPGHGMSRRSPS